MAIFRVTHKSTGTTMVVRANCLNCARKVASENSGDEGAQAWLDPMESDVELIRDTDKSGLILKS